MLTLSPAGDELTLDFAKALQGSPAGHDLGFLQAEVDQEQGATYRFIPGVATTSLAAGTAQRLGVTLDDLERKLTERLNSRPPLPL